MRIVVTTDQDIKTVRAAPLEQHGEKEKEQDAVVVEVASFPVYDRTFFIEPKASIIVLS